MTTARMACCLLEDSVAYLVRVEAWRMTWFSLSISHQMCDSCGWCKNMIWWIATSICITFSINILKWRKNKDKKRVLEFQKRGSLVPKVYFVISHTKCHLVIETIFWYIEFKLENMSRHDSKPDVYVWKIYCSHKLGVYPVGNLLH